MLLLLFLCSRRGEKQLPSLYFFFLDFDWMNPKKRFIHNQFTLSLRKKWMTQELNHPSPVHREIKGIYTHTEREIERP
jgi:hypothetical protein